MKGRHTKAFVIGAVIVVVFSAVICGIAAICLHAMGDKAEWWVFVIFPVGAIAFYGLFCWIYFGAASHRSDSFDKWLADNRFDQSHRYECTTGTREASICIDFDSQRVASTEFYGFSLPFERIANCQIELSSVPGGKTGFAVVVSVRNKDAEDTFWSQSFFVATLSEQIDEVSEELIVRYPELGDAFAFAADMQHVLDVNVKNGVNAQIVEIPLEEDWVKPDDFDEPHYSKPPYSK